MKHYIKQITQIQCDILISIKRFSWDDGEASQAPRLDDME